MSNRLEALSYTGRRMIAASLEIDGRADRAAEAVVPGFIAEFSYEYLTPVSPKAIELEELKAEIDAEIARVGVPALVETLRTLRIPARTITDDAKVAFGRDNYSTRLDCPTCATTGRHDGTVCGRCAGAGFVWAKPAAPTEAEKAEAEAKLAEEAEKNARHRAEGEAIRAAARRRRERLKNATLGTVGPTLAALPDMTRRAIGASLEIDEEVDMPLNPALAVSYAVNGTESLYVVKVHGLRVEATREQAAHASALVGEVVALIESVGPLGAVATLRPPYGMPEDLAVTEPEKIIDAEIEDQVAAFAATLDTLTAPKTESDARVFPLRQAEASGRADLVVMLCDNCFSVKDRVADCFRCEGHGLVWLTPAALEAKAASVEERRNAPVTDPADLEDDEPTADRARVWDEAADAYRRALRTTVRFPLVNPYYAAPVAD